MNPSRAAAPPGGGHAAAPAGVPCWAPPGAAPRHQPVSGRLTADVAVVGAGLAGLATAFRLVRERPGLDVVVVDARQPAAGASGRGTGLLGPRVGPPLDRAVRRFGPQTARRMYRASENAVQQVLDLCEDLGLRCTLSRGEQLLAARSSAGLSMLLRQAAAFRALDLGEVRLLGATALRDHIDAPYTAALRFPTAATLDPAALTSALARACADKGVRFYGDSPLRDLPGTGAGRAVELAFPEGSVRCDRAVLALGAEAAALGLPVGTVLPLEVYAVATARLPPPAHQALGGPLGSSVVDAVPLAPYFRLSPDGRVIAGGGTAVLPDGLSPRRLAAARARSWQRLERWLRLLHPDLAAVPLTHRWSGRIGVTGDGLPVVGEIHGHPGVWYVGGCGGHGLAMSVDHGGYVAEALLGGMPSRGPLPWHRPRAPRFPVRGPARPLIRAHVGALGAAARRTR
ncbi:FAD-binding oxidoreductase [Streptomyces sp. DSM 42041]|uniref:FAD-binding oxidoreductase n=1 Tax=Streptomyces hazeniae TaxID=3075538 RepID=A0ABU2NUA1_9ACTN|nr:FAD-binding oxidoreductase [Streptomyces sp. DSM 42041]MDT0380550.1 FAD-binding oxidoreductase [Streptomyces sp. DSM 42041]